MSAPMTTMRALEEGVWVKQTDLFIFKLGRKENLTLGLGLGLGRRPVYERTYLADHT